jgi:anti-sigma B factor antagonist
MLSQVDSTSGSRAAALGFALTRSDPDERTAVVAVAGELDLATAPELKWMLIDALQAGASQLVVDLSGSGFMDSTALGVLIGVNRSLDAGARLAIACASENVLKVFELSGMDGAFAIFPTLEEALAYVQESVARAT